MQQLLMGGSESSNRLFASPSELEQAAGLCREDVVCGVSGGAGKKKKKHSDPSLQELEPPAEVLLAHLLVLLQALPLDHQMCSAPVLV